MKNLKPLPILVLMTVVLLVVFGLSRAPHESSNLSHTSATLPAKSELNRSLPPNVREISGADKQPPSTQQAVSSPAQVKTNTHTATPSRAIIGSTWKTEQAPELTAFAQWTDRFLKATDAQRGELIPEGVELAKRRRLVLAQLIRSDPERALAAAVPLAVRARLPDEITNLLEERVSGRGELPLIGVTPAPGQQVSEPIFRAAIVNRQEYRAFTYGRRSRLATLSDASIIGIALDGALAVSDSPLRVLETGEKPSGRAIENVCVISGKVTPVTTDSPLNVTEPTAVEVNGQVQVLCEAAHVILYEDRLVAKESVNVVTAADGQPGSSGVVGRPTQVWTHGTKKVLIIRVDFSDLPGTPINPEGGQTITEDYAVNRFNDVNGVRDYYEQGSFGKTSLQIAPTVGGDSPDVTDVLRMPQPAASYATNGFPDSGNSGLLHDDGRAAAQASGFAVDTYDRIGVVFSYLGRIPGSKISYGGLANVIGKNFWINGYYDFRIVAHEIGHNYGLLHANLWFVLDGSPISPTGISAEYGDDFDIMGRGSGVENHFSHWNKSILQWIPDTSVLTVTNSGTHRIYRFDHQNANLSNTLALKIVRDSTLDYWIGYRRATSNVNLNNGAYILWGYNYNQEGNLLDMTTPGDETQDAALAIGATFTDLSANVTIQPVTQGGATPDEYLDVQVTFGAIAPIITAEPQDQIATPGQSVAFIAQSSGIPVPSYQWQRQARGTVTWTNLTEGVSYGGSSAAALIVDVATESMDGDQFRCVVSNSVGVTYSLSAVLSVRSFGVTTLAGQTGYFGYTDGTGRVGRFRDPRHLAVDSAGNIFVADEGNHTIRKITPAGVVSTFAGLARNKGSADGPASNARFHSPRGIAVDPQGNVYVADWWNCTIRKVTPAGTVSTLAGLAGSCGSVDGSGNNARFDSPEDVAVDAAGNLYVAEGEMHTIRKITPFGENWLVSTLAGLPGSSGSADGTNGAARFNFPTGVAVDGAANLYVADNGNNIIRKITPGGTVSTLAGLSPYAGSADGTRSEARFRGPSSVSVDAAGNVYVAEEQNRTIRKITPYGVVSTLAGLAGINGDSDGVGSAARFYYPTGVAVDSAGNIYVADYLNQTIRKILLAPAPQLTDVTLSIGGFRFVLNGSFGGTYVIQVSTNLVNWLPLSTNLISADGFTTITDTDMVTNPRRFYRAVPESPAGMALIPAGSVKMGDEFNEGSNDELPAHTVYVSAFYMDKYEVTKALWDDVYTWAVTHGYSFDKVGSSKAATHPVQSVSWYDCVKWCNSRSEKEGRTPAYYTSTAQTTVYRSGQIAVQTDWVKWNAGYRLPTEAEWEKAARGGASGHRFPWAESDTISWSRADYYALPLSMGGYAYDANPMQGYHPTFAVGDSPYTSPVGYFAPNGYGLYDVAGNLREWCWDWQGAYSSGSQTDPRGPTSGTARVDRGGSWNDGPFNCRVPNRDYRSPANGYDIIGFRSALPLTVPPSGMALIPAGSYTMGDTFSEGGSRELPLRSVDISAFYMDQYEVTKALWDRVYNWAIMHGYSFNNNHSGKAASHPVQTVSWYDCVKWCNARSEEENRKPAYYTDAALSVPYRTGEVSPYVKWNSGYRLPTEAEWEKAARGGTSGHRFPWVDADTITQSRANYRGYPSVYAYDLNPTTGDHPTFNDGVSPYTSPVDYFAANRYGLYDMAGNVWEWCWDWYGDYSSGSQTDPRGPASGSYRVLRGGSHTSFAFECRSAYRTPSGPTGRSDRVGFRSVLPLGP